VSTFAIFKPLDTNNDNNDNMPIAISTFPAKAENLLKPVTAVIAKRMLVSSAVPVVVNWGAYGICTYSK
jgi:hypothetical protein